MILSAGLGDLCGGGYRAERWSNATIIEKTDSSG